MATAALVFAVLAFLLALSARSKAAGMAAEIEESGRRMRRELANLTDEHAEVVRTLQRQLAVVAGGGHLDEEQILEGRLWRDVDAAEARRLFDAGGVRVLDVRTPQETAGGVIAGALRVPIGELEERVGEIEKDGRTTLVYCAGGGRSAAACEHLSQLGHANLLNLAGGFGSWNGPTERP